MNRVKTLRCRLAVVISLVVVLLNACYKKGDAVVSKPNPAQEEVTDSTVTYSNYIHDLLKNNCSTCHGDGGSAQQFWYNTNTYDNASQYGVRIMETIVENSMPPVPRKPFSNIDKQLIKAWIKRGSPK